MAYAGTLSLQKCPCDNATVIWSNKLILTCTIT